MNFGLPEIPEWVIKLCIFLTGVGIVASLALMAMIILWIIKHIQFV